MTPRVLSFPLSAHYEALCAEAFERGRARGEPPWLLALRAEALQALRASGFPTLRVEDWKYTDVRPVAEAQLALAPASPAPPPALPAALDVDDASRLVFVDGRFAPDLSRPPADPSVEWQPLEEALTNGRAEILRGIFAEGWHPSPPAFLALHTALLGGGLVLRVRRGGAPAEPVHVLFLPSGRASAPIVSPRLVVELEPDASLTLAQTHAGAGGASLTNVFTDLRVGERAALRFVKTQAEGAEAFHFGGLLSRQAAGSRVSLVDATFGARLSRSDLCARIEGEGAAAELHGLYALQARQTADFHTALDHRVPGGVSRQVYKGILDEKSRAVFNGRIFVRPGARGTDAYQINRNLLLSRQAVVDTKPQLEIDNDDVKCTHGATIGQMDRGQLFYLQSRGIGRAEAEALLARGFAAEVLSRVEHAGLRARLHGLLDRYFAAAGERRDG